MIPNDESALVHHILSRDRRALSVFYRRYTPRLRAYILTKVASADDAEEILQDALFSFLEAIRDFEGNARVMTFLFAIANHKIIDFYRKKKLKQVVFSRSPRLEAIVSPILNPEEEFDTKLLTEKIHRVFGRLLPHHRAILTLKYVEDLSVGEIAKRLAVSFKSVESGLFRARRAFAEIFSSL